MGRPSNLTTLLLGGRTGIFGLGIAKCFGTMPEMLRTLSRTGPAGSRTSVAGWVAGFSGSLGGQVILQPFFKEEGREFVSCCALSVYFRCSRWSFVSCCALLLFLSVLCLLLCFVGGCLLFLSVLVPAVLCRWLFAVLVGPCLLLCLIGGCLLFLSVLVSCCALSVAVCCSCRSLSPAVLCRWPFAVLVSPCLLLCFVGGCSRPSS